MSTNAGAVQGGGIPPVSDEDINGPVADPGTEAATSPKADKQQAQSQPDNQVAKDAPEAPAKEKGSGPWDADLAKRGITDPNVSAFLREVVQPYVTQLEQGSQQGGPVSDLFGGDMEAAEAANDLLQALRENPEEAYRELGELLELAPPGMGDGDLPDGSTPPPGDAEGLGSEQQDDPRLSYIDEMMERERTEREDAEFEGFLDQMKERMPGFDDELFTQLVVAQGGNLDNAMNIYQRYHKAPDPADDAPPTATGGTAPPAAPSYNSIGSAVDDWMKESNAASPKR